MTIGSDFSPPRRKRKASTTDTTQLGLFDDAPPPTATPAPAPASRATPAPARQANVKVSPPKQAEHRAKPHAPTIGDIRTLTIADMPDYPPDLHETVDTMLAELNTAHHLMTYRAIKECFGISRATVARRVKEGLVPGVRFSNGRVLDEGPVRRFDRTQVRWLLLSVRCPRPR